MGSVEMRVNYTGILLNDGNLFMFENRYEQCKYLVNLKYSIYKLLNACELYKHFVRHIRVLIEYG